VNHARIRSEIVRMLVDACAPTRVTDEEPDTVTDTTVVVVWTGSVRERDQWVHQYEERIILPDAGNAAAHFADRDRLTKIVAMHIDAWSPGPVFTAQRPRLELGDVTVGTTPTRAVICRHTVSEPPELSHLGD